MNSLSAFLIASACTGFTGNGHDACSKAMEATGLQIGFTQTFDKAQSALESEANKKAHYVLGDTGMGVIGSGVYVAKVVRDKSIQFNVPNFGVCDRIHTEAGVDRAAITFSWSIK